MPSVVHYDIDFLYKKPQMMWKQNTKHKPSVRVGEPIESVDIIFLLSFFDSVSIFSSKFNVFEISGFLVISLLVELLSDALLKSINKI